MKKMKDIKYNVAVVMCAMGLMLNSCSSWSNATNGGIMGSIGGTVVGAGLGAMVGGREGANIGANLGMTVGTIAGTAIGAEADAKAMQQQGSYITQQAKEEETQEFVDDVTGKTYRKISKQNDIIFESRSTKLDDESMNALQEIARTLVNNHQEIYLYGSTDDIESKDFSKELSEERARSVAGYLINLGVSASRIHVRGLGYSYPIVDNNTMDGRMMNRCVEIYEAL